MWQSRVSAGFAIALTAGVYTLLFASENLVEVVIVISFACLVD